MRTEKDKFESHIPVIEEKIGYTFADKSLLRQAFTRTSYCNEQKSHTGRQMQSNEVLEFFGDSVLSLAIVTLLMTDFAKRYEYGIYTELGEGDFSNIKSKLSDKKNLSRATLALGIQKYLQMGEGDTKLGIWEEPSVMEDLFESIIGAIYIDSGKNIGTVISSVAKMLDVKEYLHRPEQTMQSFKNSLQEWCADKKHRHPAPVYKTLSESGPDHKKTYERACYIGSDIFGVGMGKNLKIADAKAAEAALEKIMKEDTREDTQKKSDAALTRLKEYASKEHKPSPEFKDLGESVFSKTDSPEYEVECRFLGISAVGKAATKRDAKIDSAEKLLAILKEKNASNTTNPKGHRTHKTIKKKTDSITKTTSKSAKNTQKMQHAPSHAPKNAASSPNKTKGIKPKK